MTKELIHICGRLRSWGLIVGLACGIFAAAPGSYFSARAQLAQLAQSPVVADPAPTSGRSAGVPHPSDFRPGSDFLADLAERLLGAVVNISTSQKVDAAARGIPMPEIPEGSPFKDFFEDFFDRQGRSDRPRNVRSLGSGFVIDASGIIVTNNHVIEGADEIVANFNDGTKLPAKVVGRDPKTDIAVLRVQPKVPLKVAVGFGDSNAVRVAQWVMAIGNPFGLGGTVTVGIVSARNRDIDVGPYDNFIQTDASINLGNSGGPLFNLKGEVVGINTAIFSRSGGSVGIAFAVPSNLATAVVGQLLEYGETRRGWLGVRIQEVTDEIAESLGMDGPRGALIAGVNADGPAAGSGIEAGDVIVSFDGRPVREMRDLPRVVADTQPEKEVVVVLLRDGKEMTFKVTTGLLAESNDKAAADSGDGSKPDDSKSVKVLGLELMAMSDDLRRQYGIDDKVDGMVVIAVAPDSNAAERGVVPGVVIVEVAQERVKTVADVVRRIEEMKKQDRKSVLLLLADKAGELRYVALRIED